MLHLSYVMVVMWWCGVVVNALVMIDEVTLCRARLVLGWWPSAER